MGIDLYNVAGSPPCRTVLLVAEALGLKLNIINIDYAGGEHLKPDFVKMNPQHTVPTLNDNGLILSESRAIAGYLVNKYGKDDSLYPKDPVKRALVDQKLYFDIGTLFQRFADYYYPLAFGGGSEDPKKFTELEEAFEILDKFLTDQKWVAGDSFTIADISIAVTVSNPVILGFNLSKYPNVSQWFERAKKEIKGYKEINEKGAEDLKSYFPQK